MEKIKVAIIGGGASGLFLANSLHMDGVTLFERGDRLGRKLSATGNGQGNVTNLAVRERGYFSCGESRGSFAQDVIARADASALQAFFRELGVVLIADERGRVYPASRQASALTDALRYALERKGVQAYLSARVVDLEKSGNGFLLTVERGEARQKECVFAENVVLCAGGKAAKNFGSDGSAYALAQKMGHTLTALYPSLVQLKTDTRYVKTLKGIRVNNGALTAVLPDGATVVQRGDVIFTDYGVSGDAVFRVSAFIADKIADGVTLHIDFLPEISEIEIRRILEEKSAAFPVLVKSELLFGIVNNQVGRAILKRADGDLKKAAALVKNFDLTVTGSLGFDYAQVTKGGIPLAEVGDNLESRFAPNLYFAGEIVDVDGECGGFNLQWAFSSAMCVADCLNGKRRGQV